MRARDVMTTGVLTVEPKTPAPEAVRMMRENRIHHLLVKDGSARVGIVSDRDLGGRQSASATSGRTVADVMTPRVVTVDVNATTRKIANLMRGRTIGCVVVTERGRTAGLITVSDLLEQIGRGAERLAPQAERRGLHHRTAHRHKHGAAYGVW
jgi:CBS domain-containing protein